MDSGKTLTLTCQVGKGNPAPALTWSSGCGQTNTVPVGPDSIQLRADSRQSGNKVTVTENSTVTFTCNTSESNPAAALSWYNNNNPITAAEISEVSSQLGPNHGYLTTQRYTVRRVDRYQDGDVIRCEAHRPGSGSGKRVSLNLILDIAYAPVIFCNASHVTVVVGQRVKISCDVISKLEVSIVWIEDGRPVDDVSTYNFRGPNRRDVTVATIEFGAADKSLSGMYQIDARNSVGSFRMEVSITVIDGQYIPREIVIKSCSNNQGTLFWASGVDDSLVEDYKLEYKGNGEGWKTEIVRNPGKFSLAEATLSDLQPGVFYQFRVQPVSAMGLLEYATANCTVLRSQTNSALSSTSDAGLSKAAMLGVGIVVGIVVVTLVVVMVTCCLLRRGLLTWRSELRKSDKQSEDQDISMQRVDEDIEQPEPPPLGHYEELDTSPSPGPHYEDLAGNAPSSRPANSRVYENASVM